MWLGPAIRHIQQLMWQQQHAIAGADARRHACAMHAMRAHNVEMVPSNATLAPLAVDWRRPRDLHARCDVRCAYHRLRAGHGRSFARLIAHLGGLVARAAHGPLPLAPARRCLPPHASPPPPTNERIDHCASAYLLYLRWIIYCVCRTGTGACSRAADQMRRIERYASEPGGLSRNGPRAQWRAGSDRQRHSAVCDVLL